MEQKRAIVTGADGGMGRVITEALANAGFEVIMACIHKDKAENLASEIRKKTGNAQIEVREINLTSFASIDRFCRQLLEEHKPIARLHNNAGILSTEFVSTEDGLEQTVSTNYVGPYLLTRRLLPLFEKGGRIINTVSCTYAIGKIEKNFFEKGRNGMFLRIPIYSNTKYALLLFTLNLAEELKAKGISVHAADPGIVNTDMITMHQWFDPLTDILFRPFIRTPQQGAATAIAASLSTLGEVESGKCWANSHPIKLGKKYYDKNIWNTLKTQTEVHIKAAGFSL